MNEREQDIQKAILDYLEAKRRFFWRNNSGAYRTENGGYVRYGAPGSPDIFVLTDGGFLVQLEVKTKKGRQSPDQKEWQRRSEEVGAEYHVVRSIDDVIELGL